MARFSVIGSAARFGVALVLAGASCAWGQSVISARSGMINYVEGKVLVEGQPVELIKFGENPEVKNDQVLETTEGRAEVLMTPGVFLRVAENSSFKMLSNRLSDTAIEIRSGSALVEVDELLKDNAITVRYKDATIALSKQGLYRVDGDNGRLRVYDGEANVLYGIKSVEAHKGKQIELSEGLLASSFDAKDTDAFYRWASRRSESLAAANVSAARAAGTSNGSLNATVPCTGQAGSVYPTPNSLATGTANCNPYNNGGYGYSPYGMWAFNPYYGMYTYLPGMGYGYNPFGWAFYSPATVGYLYVPANYGAAVGRPAYTNVGTGPTALNSAHQTGSSGAASGNTTPLRGNTAASAASTGSNGASTGPSRSPGGATSGGTSSGGSSMSGASSAGAHSTGSVGGGGKK
jgi:hypothetical protein